MKRCVYCLRRIWPWPWAHYGFRVVSETYTDYWHPKCRDKVVHR